MLRGEYPPRKHDFQAVPVRLLEREVYDSAAPKWRNWQTRRTQNPVPREGRVGSTPTFGIGTMRDPAGGGSGGA